MTPTPFLVCWWSIRRRYDRLALPILTIMLLIGCGQAGSTPAATTPALTIPPQAAAATPPPATPIAREPRFSEIIWTTAWSGAPGEEPVAVTEIRDDSPAIIALVRARVLPAGTQIDASWTYNDTSLDAFATRVTTGDSPDDMWLAFRLDRNPEQVWPTGSYQVTVRVNNADVASDAIQVVESS